MQAVDWGRASILCHYCGQFEYFKKRSHSESDTISGSGSSHFGVNSNNMVKISKSRADVGKTTVGEAEGVCVWCSYHTTTSHNDAVFRVQQHKAGGNTDVVAAQT